MDLKDTNYCCIELRLNITSHMELTAKVNGIEGNFLLDTGASSSCIDLDAIEHFKLLTEDSNILASGAGASNMNTQSSKDNRIEIGEWKRKGFEFVLFDLSHVNGALIKHGADKVHGIIGADILMEGRAVIDYDNRDIYLKTEKQQSQ